jgi:hypothetical protein
VTSDQEPSVVVETDAPGVMAGSGDAVDVGSDAASGGGGAGAGAPATLSVWPTERPQRTLLPLGIARCQNNKG